MHRNYYILYLLLVCIFAACAPRSIREAQSIVAQADSLWREGKMYGIDEGDSATLAQAYETLNSFVHRTSSLGTFSHACYHYGKLLRVKDDPVAAMQAFIAATHSHTKDYHILGRVYSNIGDICHLAEEYSLAYDMFEQSADYFLQNGDTLLYYYGLNRSASELAVQGKKEETLALLSEIENNCSDEAIGLGISETKAILYSNMGQYDSVLIILNAYPCVHSANIVLRAQAYEHLGKTDSALYYANLVMETKMAPEQDKYNMLYIILNYDTTLQSEDILKLSSYRSDIETETLIPLHSQWAMAIQLLEQDLNKGVEWFKWALLVLIVICCIGIIFFTKKWYKHKHRANEQITALTNERVGNRIESIKNHIEGKDFHHILHWDNYSAMKTNVDLYMGGLAKKLETYNLNEVQLRFCVLTLLNLPLRKIAKEINYSYPSGIKTLKKRTSDKLGTTPPELRDFLIRL